MKLSPPATHTHCPLSLSFSPLEQESKASSLNSVSTSLIPTTTQGVNPERMTLAQGSRGPDRGERESRPRMRGRKASGPGAVMCRQLGGAQAPREQEGQGSQTCSTSSGNGMDLTTNLTPFQEKLTQLSPGKLYNNEN